MFAWQHHKDKWEFNFGFRQEPFPSEGNFVDCLPERQMTASLVSAHAL